MIFVIIINTFLLLWLYVTEFAVSPENHSSKIFSKQAKERIAAVSLSIYIALATLCTVTYVFIKINTYLNNTKSLLLGVLLTAIVLIINQIIARNIFNKNRKSNTAAQKTAHIVYIILYPFIKTTNFISDIVLNIFGIENITNNNLNDLDKVAEQIIYPEQEKEMRIFLNALDFYEVKVKECMIPRNEIVAAPESSAVDQIKNIFVKSGLSRIPVYEKDIDNITGYVSNKDLFKNIDTIKPIIRTIDFVPENMPAQKQLAFFIRHKKSVAIVVDEFGSTTGLVSMEDIMEKIFGDIEDEHDVDHLIEKQTADNEFVLSGRIEVDYINSKYDIEIPECDDYETLAGYVIHKFERIPAKGEELQIDGFTIKILKAEAAKVDLIKLSINDLK